MRWAFFAKNDSEVTVQRGDEVKIVSKVDLNYEVMHNTKLMCGVVYLANNILGEISYTNWFHP